MPLPRLAVWCPSGMLRRRSARDLGILDDEGAALVEMVKAILAERSASAGVG